MTLNIKHLSLYFLIFLFYITITFADHLFNPEAIQGMSSQEIQSFSQSEVEHNLQSIEKAVKIGELTPQQISPYIDKLSEAGLQQLTQEQLVYKDSSGIPNINKVSDWNKLDQAARDNALSQITGKSVITEGITNGQVIGNGIKFDEIDLWKIGGTTLTNCIQCIYDGTKLKFQHADSVTTGKSASTNIDYFDGFGDFFSVQQADSFLSDCIRVDNIKDSEFRVGNKVDFNY